MERDRAEQFIAWQNQNPELTDRIRTSTGKLSEVQNTMLNELCDRLDDLDLDSYGAMDFIEDSGRWLSNFNAIYQVFIQLGGEYDA